MKYDEEFNPADFVFTGLGREYALAFAERGASVVGKQKTLYFKLIILVQMQNRNALFYIQVQSRTHKHI